jgi:hypothetical protein
MEGNIYQDFPGVYDAAMTTQMKWMPEVLQMQIAAQDNLIQNLTEEQMRTASEKAPELMEMLNMYVPQALNAYYQQGAQLPGFQQAALDAAAAGQANINAMQGPAMADLDLMRQAASTNLALGYELGPALTAELEQSIRAGQTARGNWLGPAPTAQEAFGKGQASLDLYNQRFNQYGQFLGAESAFNNTFGGLQLNAANLGVGAAQAAAGMGQNYINGKSPIDMMAQMGAATGMADIFYPNNYYNMNMGADMFTNMQNLSANTSSNVFGTIQQGQSAYNTALGTTQSAYNTNLLDANNQNNNWMFQEYDRVADAWMYNEAVRNGLYSMPSMGGGSSMMGGIGSAMGGIGAGMTGLAASGLIGGGATAGAVGIAGAAAGAAAAICWLARKLIPDCWKSWRKYLFTKASDDERRDYLYNARRLSNAIA